MPIALSITRWYCFIRFGSTQIFRLTFGLIRCMLFTSSRDHAPTACDHSGYAHNNGDYRFRPGTLHARSITRGHTLRLGAGRRVGDPGVVYRGFGSAGDRRERRSHAARGGNAATTHGAPQRPCAFASVTRRRDAMDFAFRARRKRPVIAIDFGRERSVLDRVQFVWPFYRTKVLA